MKYKVGDKVRVIHTSYENINPVGSIQTVLEVSKENKNMIFLSGTRLNSFNKGWTFFTSEIEPYEEEVMNNKIEVGDTIEYFEGICKGERCIVTSIVNDESRPRMVFKEGGNDYIDNPRIKLVSKGNKMREVIGYKLKNNFKNKEYSITKALGCAGNFLEGDFGNFAKGSTFNEKAKELGVLDLWFEPVYKSSEVVVKLSGNRTCKILDKTKADINMSGYIGVIKASDVVFTLDAFNSLGQIAGYNVAIKEFQLGCQTFTIEDLKAVNQAFIDFK